MGLLAAYQDFEFPYRVPRMIAVIVISSVAWVMHGIRNRHTYVSFCLPQLYQLHE